MPKCSTGILQYRMCRAIHILSVKGLSRCIFLNKERPTIVIKYCNMVFRFTMFQVNFAKWYTNTCTCLLIHKSKLRCMTYLSWMQLEELQTPSLLFSKTEHQEAKLKYGMISWSSQRVYTIVEKDYSHAWGKLCHRTSYLITTPHSNNEKWLEAYNYPQTSLSL